jgi:predicted DNA-binding protein with PD1-like motif
MKIRFIDPFFVTFIISSCLFFIHACNTAPTMNSPTAFAFRLKPGQDLKKEINNFVKEKNIKAGWISTVVGSLTQYHIRFANQETGEKDTGHFEIISVTGTISVNGSHLHISVSDATGRTIGGHLLDECTVYTTAEIVILASDQMEFIRAKDGSTLWEELQVIPKTP